MYMFFKAKMSYIIIICIGKSCYGQYNICRIVGTYYRTEGKQNITSHNVKVLINISDQANVCYDSISSNVGKQ